MKIERLKPDHHQFIEGKEGILIAPGKRLSLWRPGENYFEYRLRGANDLEEIGRRWKYFEENSGREKIKNKDIVCTVEGEWGHSSNNALRVMVFPMTSEHFLAGANPTFEYPIGVQAKEIYPVKLYRMGTCAFSHTENYDIPFAVRKDDRMVDLVPTSDLENLEKSDLKQEKPALYALKRGGRKHFVEPNSAESKGVIISDLWRNMSVFHEAEVDSKRIQDEFGLEDIEFYLPKAERMKYLKKIPKGSKYSHVFLCPWARIHDYIITSSELFRDRTRAILYERFEI